MNWRKGITVAALTAAISFTCATPAPAQAPAGPVQAPTAGAPAAQTPAFVTLAAKYPVRDYVNDYAGVLDPDMRTQLTALAKQIAMDRHVHVNFVIVPTLNGVDPKAVSMAIGNNWSAIYTSNERNVQILLDIQERKSRLEVCRNLESVVTDDEAATILKDMTPMLREADYGRALLSAAQSVSDLLAAKEQAAPPPTNAPPPATQNPPPPSN